MTGDLAHPMVGDYDGSGVGVVRDPQTGAVAICLNADRVADLETFLDNLPLSHDLIEGGGYDPAGVDVIWLIAGVLKGSR